jgi:hypothetical protein
VANVKLQKAPRKKPLQPFPIEELEGAETITVTRGGADVDSEETGVAGLSATDPATGVSGVGDSGTDCCSGLLLDLTTPSHTSRLHFYTHLIFHVNTMLCLASGDRSGNYPRVHLSKKHALIGCHVGRTPSPPPDAIQGNLGDRHKSSFDAD